MELVSILFFLFLLAETFVEVPAHAVGAPDAACASMTPGHPFSPQNGQSPFRIIMPKKDWKGGEPVEITLTAPQTGPPFKGFFIQVREKGGDKPLGEFDLESASDMAQSVACGGKENTAVTHTDADPKTQVKLMWTAPPKGGEFEAVVTFVQQLDKFWVKEKPSQSFKVGPGEGGSSKEVPRDSGSDSKPPNGAASNIFPLWSGILFTATALVSYKFYNFYI